MPTSNQWSIMGAKETEQACRATLDEYVADWKKGSERGAEVTVQGYTVTVRRASPPDARERRGWIETIRAEVAVRGQEASWAFPSETGYLLDSSTVRDALRRVLKGTGITRRFRIHDCRHT
ncbi:MAG TPA: hypothetical protein VEH53_02495 [archaeon]|nr:hypothetical protein [archaeon]